MTASRAPAPAKITRPGVAGALARPRLFRLLDRSHPIVWIAAPPGTGKTTLVASYLAARRLPALWYQLDAGDGDIAGFFYHMAMAARRAAPRVRRPLPLMKPEYWPTLPAFARRYFRELWARLPTRAVVVLDDYHEVPEASRLHEVVRDGIDELPAGFRLVVVSRAGPPPPFAGLGAGRSMARLDWPELRLTAVESRALARQQRRTLSAEVLRRLHERADGWAMGLLLLLERGDEAAPPDPAQASAVFDYLAAEAFGRAPAATQEFLLQTALLPRVTARLAEELTGLDSAGRILSSLASRHFVMEQRSRGEVVFQYHGLFREFLLARGRTIWPAARHGLVKRRAAALLARAGEAAAAVALLVEASDWDGLEALIAEEAAALIAQGRSQTLEAWTAALPPAVVEASPRLLYWLGTSRTPFAPGLAREQFERAFARFRERGDRPGTLNAWAAAVGTVLYEWEDFTLLDPWLAALEDLGRHERALPAGEIATRVVSTFFYALMFRRPDDPEIEALAERAVALSRDADVNRRMITGFLVTTYQLWRGEHAKAAVALELLQDLVRSPQASPLERLSCHAMEAYSRWHLAELAESAEAVKRGLDLAEATGVRVLDPHLLAQGASGALVGGDLPTARAFLRRMAAVVERGGGLHTSHYHFLAGWAAWLGRDHVRAEEHLARALSLAERAGTPFPQVWNHIGLAHVCAASGRREEAHRHLRTARAQGRALRSTLAEHMCLLAEADQALDSGDAAAGLDALRQALAIGRGRGYLAFPLWHPGIMAALCARALEAGIEVDYVRALVRRHRLLPDRPPLGADGWPWAVTVRALGGFDLEVDGAPVRSTAKVQQKPLRLLQALVAHGGIDVPAERLADALWPEASGDAASQALATTLHRLRGLLGDEQAVRLQEHLLSLDTRRVWTDVWTFDRLLAEADEAAAGDRTSDAIGLTERALALYRGPFLGARDVGAWALSQRERLRARFLRATGRLGRWVSPDDPERGLACYERGLEIDDLAEDLYQGLMSCHLRLGRPSDGLAAYERCRRTLAAGLGVAPSAATEALRRALAASGRGAPTRP